MSRKEKPAITVRTVRYVPDRNCKPRHQLQLVGRSGRILGLCNLHRLHSHGYPAWYESDNYGVKFHTLADWRRWAGQAADTLAPEFCEAERDWLPPIPAFRTNPVKGLSITLCRITS